MAQNQNLLTHALLKAAFPLLVFFSAFISINLAIRATKIEESRNNQVREALITASLSIEPFLKNGNYLEAKRLLSIFAKRPNIESMRLLSAENEVVFATEKMTAKGSLEQVVQVSINFSQSERMTFGFLSATSTSLQPFEFIALVFDELAIQILGTILVILLSSYISLRSITKPLETFLLATSSNISSRIFPNDEPEIKTRPGMPRKDIFLEAKALKTITRKIESILDIVDNENSKKIMHDVNAAIARTTQSLSHDVRKPFSMIQMIADAVYNTEDLIEAREIMVTSIPEINQAIASVDGMLADILEIGGDSKPVIENASPETLLEATLNQIFRIYSESKITVQYEFNHTHLVAVDTTKILRVFANIVGNAVQAMDCKGVLWFRTRETVIEGKTYVEFCSGNGGTFIPAENLEKLFDAFFTSGKKGGTGLGLAIAQKIVTAHGGEIWCESSSDGGKYKTKGGCVEFYFTLPASRVKSELRTLPMPASSEEIIHSFARLRDASQGKLKAEVNALDSSLEKEIINLSSQLTVKPILLFVDDEALYRNSLARLVSQSIELAKCFDIQFAACVKEELQFLTIQTPLIIVQDIDLGVGQLNGYEAIRTLRSNGFKGSISVHSNRASAADCQMALDAGADSILPKPMSRSHLLNFVLISLKNYLES
jgi:signal transduction histidine kinase/CheY-like chemotaxis protein